MPDESNASLTDFEHISIAQLDALDRAQSDALPFGVIGMSPEGLVELYNRTETKLTGLPLESLAGTHFFANTGQCMNNYLVAQRFEDEPELDAVLDYVLTLRMRPTPVRLRLLRTAAIQRMYLLVQR